MACIIAFGDRTYVWCMEKKWRVLNEFPRYDISTQRQVIFATMGLHNFIRWNKIRDFDFEEVERGSNFVQTNIDQSCDDDGIQVDEGDAQGVYMKIVRDQIADQLWRRANRRGPRRL